VSWDLLESFVELDTVVADELANGGPQDVVVREPDSLKAIQPCVATVEENPQDCGPLGVLD
jgi:hypothetical protein